MLKALIIDDEKLVRQMVMQCMDWEAAGLCIVGEASSARMGMEMIDELHPDLVVMDVRMPGMDGLTGSRMILKKHPHIRIIILSGYDEFEYASEAIRLGVSDYLLKPVNADEMQRAVAKARDAVLEERSHQKEFERYKGELEKHSSYIRDRQLSALIRTRAPQQYLESLSYFGIHIEETVFQVALVKPEFDMGQADEEEKLLMKMHIRKLLEGYFENCPHVFFSDSGADWIIVLNNEAENTMYEAAGDLKHYLEDNTDCRMCIGVGRVYHVLGKLRDSYREAKDAVQYRFVSVQEEAIFFRDIYPWYDAENSSGSNEDAMHDLGNAIRIGNDVGAEAVMNEILLRFRRSGGEREQALILAMEIFAEIMKVLAELKLELKTEQLNYSVMLERVFAQHTFDEIGVYLKQIIRTVCGCTAAEVSDKEKSLVHKVKDYIQEHYCEEEISLNLLAQLHYVNSSYLSRVFKEKTGSTFTGYLFEIRMKKAVELVLRTDLRVYEIAERIGISDPHYFSSCFKKYTGLSVASYKKNFLIKGGNTV